MSIDNNHFLVLDDHAYQLRGHAASNKILKLDRSQELKTLSL
jgi:hypothetical protein